MYDKSSIDSILKRHLSIRSKKMLRRVRKYFLTGILVTAPIAITLYLAYVFILFMDHQVAKIIPGHFGPYQEETIFPGSGLVITLVFFVAVGWLTSNVLGQMFVTFSEYIMTHMPVIRIFYNAIKQVIETLMGSQAKAFREVVLIEYPRAGCWTIGFVTGSAEGEIAQGTGASDVISVFVPTAPSPVNGFLLFVPRAEAVSLKMSVEEGVKMVVSMGMIAPAVPLPPADPAENIGIPPAA
jgi:uncharacterized membrane protein